MEFPALSATNKIGNIDSLGGGVSYIGHMTPCTPRPIGGASIAANELRFEEQHRITARPSSRAKSLSSFQLSIEVLILLEDRQGLSENSCLTNRRDNHFAMLS